ncbi:radial spoke head protein 3 homolog [Sipha flava]|uniref:Radial spoke head protein 3 homolog n=1 Tax=Sipha flava TaxID=143950 RepID=A0A8B8GCN5_9HEMI|nr:radial spoke head protein 3 homolog [Sipha flava]
MIWVKKQMNKSSYCLYRTCRQLVSSNIVQDKAVIGDEPFPKKTFKIKESPAARDAEARRLVIARRKAADQEVKAWRLYLETLKISKPRQLEQIKKYLNEKVKESPEVRQVQREVRRRALATKKAIYQEVRACRLHLKKPKTSEPRQIARTDTYLTELYGQHPQTQKISTQTEEMFASSAEVMLTGTDGCTQVDEMELFDYDKAVTPIVDSMIGDVLRQAINEVQYADELAARDRYQRISYLESTTVNNENLRMEKEDERIRKTIAEHTRYFDEGEKNENIRISQLPPSYKVDFLPRVLLDSNKNESNIDTITQAQSLEFISWLMTDLQEKKTKNITIENLLENIHRDRIRT